MLILWIITTGLFIYLYFGLKATLGERIGRLERLLLDLEGQLKKVRAGFTPEHKSESAETPVSSAPAELEPDRTGAAAMTSTAMDREAPVFSLFQAEPSRPADETAENGFNLPEEIPPSSEKTPWGEMPLAGPYSAPEKNPWREKWQSFKATVDWEQFTGVKLFAWLGGFALFIATAFFVKFSIDRNILPPAFRLALGALTGIGMIGGSLRVRNEKYAVLRQTLASGGIGVLYSVIFAATLYYDYLPKTFGLALLVLTSATAFVLAVQYRAVAISILGAVGAYISPVLISTGQGSLPMLLGYLGVINLGLYLVVQRLSSRMLLLVAALGTLITLALATGAGFDKIDGTTISLVWGLNLSLFTAFLWHWNDDPRESRSTRWTGIGLYSGTLAAAAALLLKPGFGPVLLATAGQCGAIVMAFRNRQWYGSVIPFSALGFGVVLTWLLFRFNADRFSLDFIFLFLYSAAGGLGPILLVRMYGLNRNLLYWFRTFPSIIVILGAWTIFRDPRVSLWFWPLMLGLELLGISLSILFRGFVQVGLLVLVILATALQWIFNSPELTLGPGFFVFILMAGAMMCGLIFVILKNLSALQAVLHSDQSEAAPGKESAFSVDLEQWMAAAPAAGISILLAASFTVDYPFYPHPGMVTLLCFLVLVLFAADRLKFELPGAAALIASALAQAVFVFHPTLGPEAGFSAMAWSGVLFLLAVPAPFLLFPSIREWKKMWNAWAIFEAMQAIFLLYATRMQIPSPAAHWIPLLLFCIKLPAVVLLLRRLDKNSVRNAILAFHGGVLLFYLSALPISVLNHGWIGLTFVFEAAALLWLNRRIEHPGLRWVSSFMAPAGLLILLIHLPRLKTLESLPVLNPAVLSVAAAILALGFAVSQAGFPERRLRSIDLPVYFLWMTVGTGFFLINLIISDLFAAPGSRFSIWPGRNFLQSGCYAFSWAALGGVLWRAAGLPDSIRRAALVLISAGALWIIGLPFVLPETIGRMPPFFNTALFAYLPLMALLFYLFLREEWNDQRSLIKNLFLLLFLTAGFLFIKIESSTIFQSGYPFSLRFSQTPLKAAVSAAGWFFYGLGLLVWPKRLDRPFRMAGLILIAIGLFKSLLIPFLFRTEFARMVPLINIPTLIYGIFLGIFLWLTLREWNSKWPLPRINPRAGWGITLAVTAFAVLNLEIASGFAIKGRPFSMLTHGSLSMQLAYSIGWLLFSISLLAVGIRRDAVKVRWAAIMAIVFTAFKIFIRDLWSLGQLYRVGSLLGLAMVLILVSILYQRFLSKGKQDAN